MNFIISIRERNRCIVRYLSRENIRSNQDDEVGWSEEEEKSWINMMGLPLKTDKYKEEDAREESTS